MKQLLNTYKIFLFIFSAFVSMSNLFAQDYPMSTTIVTDCTGFFLDSGANGMYGANEDLTMTFCPDLDSNLGTHIQLAFSGTDLMAGDVLCFFDGPDATAPALGCNTDFAPGAAFNVQATAVNTGGCLTITFNSDAAGQATGWEADINCIPSCQLIQSVIVSSDPPIMPADTGYIDICPGDRVFLDGMGIYPQAGIIYPQSDFTSTFEWDFGDGIQGVGPSVAHTYEEPGGYIIQLTITDELGCQNTNYVSQRVRVSPYPVYETGEDLPEEICQGDTIALNAVIANVDENVNVSVNAGTGGFQTGQIRSDSLALPDGTGAAYETPVSFTNFSPGQTLTNVDDIVSVCVNIEHSYLRDLEIKLRCPDGNEIILHNFAGQTGGGVFLGEPVDNDGNPPIPGVGYDYCWTPNAINSTWINFINANPVTTLPEGDYSPFESFDNFLGCSLNGDWTIVVQDLWGIDNGIIFSWGITFAQDLYPSIETFSPTFTEWNWQENPSVFFETADSIAAVPNAGTASYTFQTQNDFGCAFDTTFALTVLPRTHPDCFSCDEQLIPQNDTTICEGEIVNYNVAAQVESETPIKFETVPNYPLGKSNHPPANAYFSMIAVNSVIPTTILDPFTDIISVCVDFDTDWDSDIQMGLVTPSGQFLELSTNNGGSGDNYTNTCFTPNAVDPITAGIPPFTGDYMPEGDWNVLTGEAINGEWALKISDSAGNNKMGLLKSWNITFRSTNEVIYSWNPPADLSCFLCPDPTASPTQTTTYEVSSVSSYGCVAADELTIHVVNIIPAPISTCESNDDGSMTISWTPVAGVTEYEINTGGSFETVAGLEYTVPGPFVPGDQITYDIQSVFTGGNCGIETLTETCTYVLNCDMFISTADGSTTGSVDCSGNCEGVISISAFDASASILGYTIFNNGTLETMTQTGGGQFTGLCAGTYTFTAEDALGCTSVFDYVLTEPDVIEVTNTETIDVSCNGGANGSATISATGGNGNYSYQWDDDQLQTTATATFLSAGTYTPVITDDLGCSQNITIIIEEPEPLTSNIVISNVLCFGDQTGSISVTPMGGTAPYLQDWGSGDGTGLPAGQYTVTVTDALNCDLVVTETINEPAEPLSLEVTQTFISCFGTDESVGLATAMGGTLDYNYEWDNGNLDATGTNLSAVGHTVTVTDGNACTLEGEILIEELDELVPNVIPESTSCNGSNDGAAAVNFSLGGIGTELDDLIFNWSTGATSQAIENIGGGIITVTVTDTQGCIGIGETFIDTPTSISVLTEGNSPLCFGGTNGSASVTDVLNGAGNVQYQWDAAANNQITAVATDLTAGTYSVTVIDGSDCTTTEIVEVAEPEPIAIEFETIDNDCPADQLGEINATITGGTGNYAYLWSNDSTSQDLTSLSADTYYLTVVDDNNCMNNDSISILSPVPIDADIEVDSVECFGDRNGQIVVTPIGGTSPFLYSLDGITFSGSSTQIGLEAGDYDVYIQDANGCVQTFEASVYQPPLLNAAVGARGDTLRNGDEVLLNLGDSLQLFGLSLESQGPTMFTWGEPYEGTLTDSTSLPSNNVAWTNTQNTIDYSLVVRDSVGCLAEMLFRVRVIKDRTVLIPTGFSPNDDNNNDVLLVHGKEGTLINVFRVFDRWGELLFETTEPFEVNTTEVSWDGTFRGEKMPTGVYVWYLEAEYIDGNKESFKGNTTLLR